LRCNLYSITKGQQAIRDLAALPAKRRHVLDQAEAV
jgi:hypothetical protein